MGCGGLEARRDRIKKGLSESNSTVNLTPQSVPAYGHKYTTRLLASLGCASGPNFTSSIIPMNLVIIFKQGNLLL